MRRLLTSALTLVLIAAVDVHLARPAAAGPEDGAGDATQGVGTADVGEPPQMPAPDADATLVRRSPPDVGQEAPPRAAGGGETWSRQGRPSSGPRYANGGPGGGPPPLVVSGRLGYDFIFGGDFSGTDSSVNTQVVTTELLFQKSMPLYGRLSVQFRYQRRAYAFRGVNDLPGSDDPVGKMNVIRLRLRYLQPCSEEWAAFVLLRFLSSFESGAGFKDSLSWGGIVGVGKQFKGIGKSLQLGVGIAFFDRIAESPFVFPGIQFDWQITDKWRAALLGLEFDLGYTLNEKWQFGFNAEFESPRARLRNRGPNPRGIFTDSRLMAKLRVKYTPVKRVDLEAYVGADLYRELFFEDPNGDNEESFTSSMAPILGISVTARF